MEERFLPDQPEGLARVCAKMQQERDPEQLAVMVGRINSLLTPAREETLIKG